MGCRTRANEYYATMTQRQVQLNRHTEHTVEGNVVRKSVPKKQEPVRIRKRKKKTTSISAAKALASQRRRLIALGAIGSVIFIALCAVMLNSLEKGNALAMEVESKESELNALTVANDAREYEIDSSSDVGIPEELPV